MKLTALERTRKAPDLDQLYNRTKEARRMGMVFDERLGPRPKKPRVGPPTTADKCREAGLYPAAVRQYRYRHPHVDMTDEQIIECLLERRRRPKVRTLALAMGMNPETLRHRLGAMGLLQALTQPVLTQQEAGRLAGKRSANKPRPPAVKVPTKGKHRPSVTALAHVMGMVPETLRRRMQAMDLAEALTEPLTSSKEAARLAGKRSAQIREQKRIEARRERQKRNACR